MHQERDELVIAEVLETLNRSQHSMREDSFFTAREAAEKQFEVCRQWLRDKRISHRMNDRGEWILG
jgi:hypothetical protein